MAAILPDEIRCVELLAEILGLGGTDRSVSQPALYKALLNSFRVWFHRLKVGGGGPAR
jgi:hypothetical protein